MNNLINQTNNYEVNEIETVEECERLLEIEYKLKEQYEKEGVKLIEDKQVTPTIDSREVAEMMDIEHKNLLSKIDKINNNFRSLKISYQKYWIVDTFENRGKEYRCFKITKLGCEFLAHKSTGEKGILFTDRYMTRFEEMKSMLQNGNIPSYQVINPIERALKWIQEQKQNEYKQCLLRIETLKERNTNLMLLHSNKTYTTTEIAKELGFTSARVLNKELEDRKIQYKVNSTWTLYSQYSDKGYTEHKQKILNSGYIVYNLHWTEKGRRFLLDLFNNK